MTLGKVVGTLVATRKDEKLVGSKLLIVQAVDLDGNLIRQYTVAMDAVGAGIGEMVLTSSNLSRDWDRQLIILKKLFQKLVISIRKNGLS